MDLDFLIGAGVGGAIATAATALYYEWRERHSAKHVVKRLDRVLGLRDDEPEDAIPRPKGNLVIANVVDDRSPAGGDFRGYPVLWVNGFPDCRRHECMNTAPHSPGERCIT